MDLEVQEQDHEKVRIIPGTRDHVSQANFLIQEFCKESLEEYGLVFSEPAVNAAVDLFIDYSFVCFVGDKLVGLIAGQVTTQVVTGNKMFQEQMWFVSKPYRKYGIKLLKAMETRCLDEGIKTLVLAFMGNSKPEKLERFYLNLGYRFMEAHYVKTFPS